jgi:hypothetical protein
LVGPRNGRSGSVSCERCRAFHDTQKRGDLTPSRDRGRHRSTSLLPRSVAYWAVGEPCYFESQDHRMVVHIKIVRFARNARHGAKPFRDGVRNQVGAVYARSMEQG